MYHSAAAVVDTNALSVSFIFKKNFAPVDLFTVVHSGHILYSQNPLHTFPATFP